MSWMLLEKFVTPSTINLYSDYTGRMLLELAIVYSNEKDVKDRILKVLQMGADVMQDGTDWFENVLPVESAVKSGRGKLAS